MGGCAGLKRVALFVSNRLLDQRPKARRDFTHNFDAFVAQHFFVINFYDPALIALLSGFRFETNAVIVHVGPLPNGM